MEFASTIYITSNLTATTCTAPLDLTNVTVNGTTNISASCDATIDTDGDGIPDYLDTDELDGPLADYDNDGLLNQNDPDDDNDGILDVVEIAAGTDSLNSDDPVLGGNLDTDGDSMVDGIDPDDDNDGMSDVYEDAHGLDRTDALDADADLDGDGYTNKEEHDAGTNPDDYYDVPVANNANFNPAVMMYILN